jgi:putative ABC transport system permease protein
MFDRLIAYVRGMSRRRAIESEVDEELAFHVQFETEANIARGMPPDRARREALRSIGGLVQTTEAIRDVRSTTLDAIWRDIRHAVRSLRATPAFTTVALVVLALSIGATTAIYSVVDGVMLRELPFPGADRLVAVGERHIRDASDKDLNLVAPQNFLDWRAQQNVFTGLAAVGYASISVRPEPGREPETLETQAVTAEFFSVLGVRPLIGRTFTSENEVDGRALVAVISHRLWQRRFGGAADIIGRHLPGQRADFEILGVMPPSFAYPVGAMRATDVWIPNVFRPEDRVRANEYSYRLQVTGRLRDGVSVELAQARMDRTARRHGPVGAGVRLSVRNAAPRSVGLRGRGRHAGGHWHHRRALSRAPGGQGRSAGRLARRVVLMLPNMAALDGQPKSSSYDATQTRALSHSTDC